MHICVRKHGYVRVGRHDDVYNGVYMLNHNRAYWCYRRVRMHVCMHT